MKVELKCGTENVLTSIDEPSKCEYIAIFESPAACSVAHAQVSPQVIGTS